MPLPSISNYAIATRQPIDLVGPAIDAFRVVNSELLKTRAQNLAEQKDARQAGRERKEGLQDDRMFEENIIDRRLNRDLAIEDQAMEREAHGMDMAMAQFELDNLMPLQMQQQQMQLALRQQEFNAAQDSMDSQARLMGLAEENISRLDGMMSGEAPIPETALYPGESPDDPMVRVRAVNGYLDFLEQDVAPAMKDKAFSVRVAERRRQLMADPFYQQALAEGGGNLLLPRQREVRDANRLRQLRARLPFGTQEDRAGWIQDNQDIVEDLLEMPEPAFGESLDSLEGRLQDDVRFWRKESQGSGIGGSGGGPDGGLSVSQRSVKLRMDEAGEELLRAESALDAAKERGLSGSLMSGVESEYEQARKVYDYWSQKAAEAGIPVGGSTGSGATMPFYGGQPAPATPQGTTADSFYNF